MQVKSIAECSKESILQYFRPSLSYHLSVRSFLSIFEWPLKTGFTVFISNIEVYVSIQGNKSIMQAYFYKIFFQHGRKADFLTKQEADTFYLSICLAKVKQNFATHL